MSGAPDPHVNELVRALPDLAVSTIEPLGAGDFTRAYLLNGHIVLRIARHAEAAAALRREACVLARIRDHVPCRVPAPTHMQVHEQSVSLHELVPGTELTKQRWIGLPRDAQLRIARDVAGFLSALHAIDITAVSCCELHVLDPVVQTELTLQRLRDQHAMLLPEPASRAVAEWFAARLQGGAAWSYRPSLLHADFGPDHVLVDADAMITGVIDWGDVCSGDPARDFIFVYEDWGIDVLRQVLDAYTQSRPERLWRRTAICYLLDQLNWTMAAREQGRVPDVEQGVAALVQALADFGPVDDG